MFHHSAQQSISIGNDMETPSSVLSTERKSVYCCYGNKNAYHEWKLAAFFDLYANLLLSDLHSSLSERNLKKF